MQYEEKKLIMEWSCCFCGDAMKKQIAVRRLAEETTAMRTLENSVGWIQQSEVIVTYA